MSKITSEEIRRIAALAHIGLSDDEVESFAGELASIVGFVEQLGSVKLEDVESTDQVTGLVDSWREDAVVPGLTHADLQKNAPHWQDGYYRVKRVLNND